jgi:succinylglutamate desuccinylase
VHFLDLHSTSAPGVPFAMIPDEPGSRDLALALPLPVILGLLELVDSTLLVYMRRLGHVTLGIEAGQNDDERSVDHHEAALWLALVQTGILAASQVADLPRHRALLEAARGDLPHLMAVEHRHAIRELDAFRMVPGYTNVQRVRAGDILAHDRQGPVRAARDGILMLPLYQAQGDDGFFFGREVPVKEPVEVRA